MAAFQKLHFILGGGGGEQNIVIILSIKQYLFWSGFANGDLSR